MSNLRTRLRWPHHLTPSLVLQLLHVNTNIAVNLRVAIQNLAPKRRAQPNFPPIADSAIRFASVSRRNIKSNLTPTQLHPPRNVVPQSLKLNQMWSIHHLNLSAKASRQNSLPRGSQNPSHDSPITPFQLLFTQRSLNSPGNLLKPASVLVSVAESVHLITPPIVKLSPTLRGTGISRENRMSPPISLSFSITWLMVAGNVLGRIVVAIVKLLSPDTVSQSTFKKVQGEVPSLVTCVFIGVINAIWGTILRPPNSLCFSVPFPSRLPRPCI